jgi:hypothetical protein
MPFAELKPFMTEESLDYAGPTFPALNHDTPASAVIEVGREEAETQWQAGFYLTGKTPPQFEESLRAFCKAASKPI